MNQTIEKELGFKIDDSGMFSDGWRTDKRHSLLWNALLSRELLLRQREHEIELQRRLLSIAEEEQNKLAERITDFTSELQKQEEAVERIRKQTIKDCAKIAYKEMKRLKPIGEYEHAYSEAASEIEAQLRRLMKSLC